MLRKSALLRCPPEVLHHLCRFIGDLYHFALVCRAVNPIAQEHLLRGLSFKLPNANIYSLFVQIVQQPVNSRLITQIHITRNFHVKYQAIADQAITSINPFIINLLLSLPADNNVRSIRMMPSIHSEPVTVPSTLPHLPKLRELALDWSTPGFLSIGQWILSACKDRITDFIIGEGNELDPPPLICPTRLVNFICVSGFTDFLNSMLEANTSTLQHIELVQCHDWYPSGKFTLPSLRSLAFEEILLVDAVSLISTNRIHLTSLLYSYPGPIDTPDLIMVLEAVAPTLRSLYLDLPMFGMPSARYINDEHLDQCSGDLLEVIQTFQKLRHLVLKDIRLNVFDIGHKMPSLRFLQVYVPSSNIPNIALLAHVAPILAHIEQFTIETSFGTPKGEFRIHKGIRFLKRSGPLHLGIGIHRATQIMYRNPKYRYWADEGWKWDSM